MSETCSFYIFIYVLENKMKRFGDQKVDLVNSLDLENSGSPKN